MLNLASENKARSSRVEDRRAGSNPNHGALPLEPAPRTKFRLCLLGTLQLDSEGVPLRGLRSRKAVALLSYLIVREEAVLRASLAALFWPHLPEARALRNLTWTLSRIEHHLPGCLRLDSHSVRFRSNGTLWVDIAMFRDLSAHDNNVTLAQAAALYRGEFLEGFYLDDCPEFELWLMREREVWHQRLIETLETIIVQKRQQGDYRQALIFAERLIQLEPWREEAHRHRMVLLALNGQRGAALTQYEVCRKVLAEELDIEPSDETTSLYQQIRDGVINNQLSEAPPLVEAPQRVYNSLSVAPPLFIGRVEELAQLESYLADPAIRLITIVGPGGVGKTRLALQLAQQQQPNFRHGAVVVPLASADTLQSVVFAVASTLGTAFVDTEDPIAQLRQSLRFRHMLLILDNFEHLIDSRALLQDLLNAAPQLNLVVTSRERLQLQSEYVFRLEGLEMADEVADDTATPAPALLLFAERARQADRTFQLTDENRASVAEICRMVEGSPLGIELAATWVNQLSAQQIAEALRDNLDLLTTTMQDVPIRHSSVRAVFEGSWRLLSPAEQRALAQLAVFRGGFTQEAMVAVTEATMWELVALVNKSLVRRSSSGRYELHELARQYATEQLSKQTRVQGLSEQAVRERHSLFYLRLVGQSTAALQGTHPRQALDKLRPDLDNIRRAWQWAVQHTKLDEISKCLFGVSRLYLLLCLPREAEEVFQLAAERLESLRIEDQSPSHELLLVLGKLRAEQVTFLSSQAQFNRAASLAESTLEIARSTKAVDLESLLWCRWAYALFQLGQYEIAHNYAQQGIDCARAIANRQLECWCLSLLGNILVQQSDYPAGRACFEQSLRFHQLLGDRRGEGESLNCLGMIAWYSGDFATAKSYYERYLQIAQEIGSRREIALALHNLADALWPRGEYFQSRQNFAQALEIYQELGDRRGIGLTLANSGRVLMLLGQHQEAKQCFVEALQIARAHGLRWTESWSLTSLGLLAHQQGNDVVARLYSSQGLAIAQESGERDEQAYALTCLGHAMTGLGQFDQALGAYQQALALRQELDQHHWVAEIIAGLARITLARGDLVSAQGYVDTILSYLDQNPWAACEDSSRIYQTCYNILTAANDARAQMIQDRLLMLFASVDDHHGSALAREQPFSSSDSRGSITGRGHLSL